MQCGLFGKLPAKRDFVAHNMPRPFLDAWETWLQSGVAESQHALGERWKETFLTLPIWRFWCGPSVFGLPVTGAVMASVDGVGRYFPLSICACGSASEHPLPPPNAALNSWLNLCEQTLLGMLDEQSQYDPTRTLGQLGLPPAHVLQVTRGTGPSRIWTATDGSLQTAFDDLAAADQSLLNSRRSLWWTLGGQNHPELLITTEGSLTPSLWISFMTGQIAT